MEFNFHHLPGQFDLNTKPFSFPFSKLWQFFTSGNSSGSCHGAGSTWWHGSFCRAGPELLSESLKGTWWKAPSSGATFECGTHRHEIIYAVDVSPLGCKKNLGSSICPGPFRQQQLVG